MEPDRAGEAELRADAACTTARRIHAGQLTRSGDALIDHVERVARSVPPHARALAYLHDALERAGDAAGELLELRLTDEERSVLDLLTRDPTESYEAYVMRIASANGSAGRIARTIKLADLDDHLTHLRIGTGAPDYAWARRQVVASQRARGETPRTGRRTAKRAA